MKMHTAVLLTATLMLASSGCATSQGTSLGQSPNHHNKNVNVIPARNGNLTTIQNYLHDQHDFPQQVSHHSTSGFPGYSGFACPDGGACQTGGCPGGCGPGCGHQLGTPHHYHSYSYSRPQNLTYPQQGATGGAVVYPYYTHKGPSDFFRDDQSVLGKR